MTIAGANLVGAVAVTFGTAILRPGPAGFQAESATQITAVAPLARAAGTVAVRVLTGAGQSADTSRDDFTYAVVAVASSPVVSGLTPSAGRPSGLNEVVLAGSGFANATGVLFGSSPATILSRPPGQIRVQAPAHAAGYVDVTVMTPTATSNPAGVGNDYIYTDEPAVTAVSPPRGPLAAGTRLTITGNGFLGATAVKVRTASGTGVQLLSATQVAVLSPTLAAGPQRVQVITPAGASADTPGDDFTAVPGSITVTALSPGLDSARGGNPVVVSGSNFTGTTAVLFGGVSASVTSVAPTRITVVAPRHPAGVVDVTVVNPLASSPPGGPGDSYRFLNP